MNIHRRNAIPWWGWWTWLCLIAAEAFLYPRLPVTMPVHFNWAGHPDRYAARIEALLTMPSVIFVLMLLWQILWRIDPRRDSYGEFWATYRFIGGFLVLVCSIIQIWMITQSLSWGASSRVGPTVVGVMLVCLANVLPRIQPNWWIGIRTPWTLSSESSWRQTHRLAGHLGVLVGIMVIALSWCLPIAFVGWMALVLIGAWGAVSLVASYVDARPNL
ncbi:MAG: SdpI family protein [Alicyclobacillus sp.]|nr:SdpI family protein [Alicyclobacillus sp.]